MADRSDRGQQSPRWSTSLELVRMIGRWSADLIEASGQEPRSQAEWMAAAKTPCPSFEKALATREASMDGPDGASLTEEGYWVVNARLTPAPASLTCMDKIPIMS